MGGVGSKRMMIDEVSPGFLKYMNTVSDINYGNIELRKKRAFNSYKQRIKKLQLGNSFLPIKHLQNKRL